MPLIRIPDGCVLYNVLTGFKALWIKCAPFLCL